VTPAPTDSAGRPLEGRDPRKPPARGTRSTGWDEEAGAPEGEWDPEHSKTAAGAVVAEPPPAAAPAKAGPPKALPAKAPPSPAGYVPATPTPPAAPGRTVPKSVAKPAPAPKPAPFPPEALRAECEALLARYPEKAAALIPILHVAQRKLGGWISPELEAGIGAYLGVSDQHVRGVLTFYTMFNLKPVGRWHVQVCRTLSCMLRGAPALTACLERKTGLRPGQTDAERRFTVSEVECIGLCEVAPAIFVNDDEHVSVTPDSLEKLLDGLK
jgi:NADH-quinone oxidoreductase E subunit